MKQLVTALMLFALVASCLIVQFHNSPTPKPSQ